MVAEILLDRIEQECPNILVRAYADDTALVLKDFWKDAPKLPRIFDEFADISGLHLNLHKSSIIPLCVYSSDHFKAMRDARVPKWKDMPISESGKYLGFYTGKRLAVMVGAH